MMRMIADTSTTSKSWLNVRKILWFNYSIPVSESECNQLPYNNPHFSKETNAQLRKEENTDIQKDIALQFAI